MKEKESVSTEPKENKALLIRTLGYAHRLREEAGSGYAVIPLGILLCGVGVIALKVGFDQQTIFRAGSMIAGGVTSMLMGVGVIYFSRDS